MKEALIAFVIALVIGSIINGSNSEQAQAGSSSPTVGSNPATAAADALVSTVSVDEKNFDEVVIDSQTPVLVDFYADTCAPCKRMEPIIGEIANEYQGAVKVARIDVLRAPNLARKYQIAGIPVFMTFKDGKVEQTTTGAQPKSEILAMIKPLLPADESRQAEQ